VIDLEAADDEGHALLERVRVEAEADAHAHCWQCKSSADEDGNRVRQ
jgi:hypothetical protein